MNIYIRAVIHTALILISCVVLAGLTAFIVANVPLQTILNGIGIAFIIWCVYILYSICLSQLRYDEQLKDLRDRK